MASSSSQAPVSNGFSNFQYKPLDLTSKKPSIRLGTLHSGAADDSMIKISLAHAAFGERPEYEALSYTWGSPDVQWEIELDVVRVKVRRNLWTALKHLRDPSRDRVLWIDAICISQGDVEERTHQVQLMAYIFARA